MGGLKRYPLDQIFAKLGSMKKITDKISGILALLILSAGPAFADSNLQTVVVTRLDLKAGVVLVAGQLEEKNVEKRLAPLNAVAGVAECVGRVLKRNRTKGQTVLIDDLGNP